MNEERLVSPESQTEPTWTEKVVALSRALGEAGIPYAFGGAIALNYHRDPRSTLDIDINVFLAPDDEIAALSCLETLSGLPDRERVEHGLRDDGQARSLWGTTYIDLFFSNTDFHVSMASRVVQEPFAGTEIPVLSIEDLLVCKVLFDRPKDWQDIEAVIATRGTSLDLGYMRAWLNSFLANDDHRFGRLEARTQAKA